MKKLLSIFNRKDNDKPQTTFQKLTADGEFSLDLKNKGNRKLLMAEIEKFKDFKV